MLLGNNVFDQNFDRAEFQELGSAPPSMEAARAADALNLFPGDSPKQSDATSGGQPTGTGGTIIPLFLSSLRSTDTLTKGVLGADV